MSIFISTKEFVINGGLADDRVVAAGLGAGLPLVTDVADVADVVLLVADVVVLLLDDVDLADKFAPKFKEDAFAVGTASVLLQLFAHGLDGVADL